MMKYILTISIAFFSVFCTIAQDRFSVIEQKLTVLTPDNPGLNGKVELSVSGAPLQEMIRGIAQVNGLNISVDPDVNVNVVNNFSNVTVKDVILFIAREYNLDVSFVGSIITFSNIAAPKVEAPVFTPKAIEIKYDKKTDQLTLNLKNDTLFAVAKEITSVTGKNVICAPGLGTSIVSSYVYALPFLDALNSMAFSNDFKIDLTPNNVYTISKKEVANEVRQNSADGASGGKKGKKGINATDDATPDGLSLEMDEAGLISVIAGNVPLLDVIKAVSQKAKMNYFLVSEITGNISFNISGLSYEDFLKYVFNGTNFSYKKDGSIYMMGDRTFEGLRATSMIPIRYRSIQDVAEMIPSNIKKGVEIKAFEEQNSLLITGSQEAIDEIESFIRGIDKTVPVVLIELIVTNVTNKVQISSGISMGVDSKVAKGGTLNPKFNYTFGTTSISKLLSVLGGGGLINLGNVSSDFYVNLQALEEQGYIKVKSMPKLATLNSHEASMSIGETEYYSQTSSTVIPGTTPTTVSQTTYNAVNASFQLTIKPYLSSDDYVTLEVSVTQADFTARISPEAPPGQTNTTFKSLIRVKNNEMVVLGGLEKKSVTETGSGVPFLSRVPVLKYFFSKRSRESKTEKLSIFIKPTIIY